MIVDDISFHDKRVEHKRTKVIRTIYVLQGTATPSSEANKGLYNPFTNILYDTYAVNKQFYNLLND